MDGPELREGSRRSSQDTARSDNVYRDNTKIEAPCKLYSKCSATFANKVVGSHATDQ